MTEIVWTRTGGKTHRVEFREPPIPGVLGVATDSWGRSWLTVDGHCRTVLSPLANLGFGLVAPYNSLIAMQQNALAQQEQIGLGRGDLGSCPMCGFSHPAFCPTGGVMATPISVVKAALGLATL